MNIIHIWLDPYTVDEIEALLLAQEERLEKYQLVDQHMLQVNIFLAPWHLKNPQNDITHFKNLYNRGGYMFSKQFYQIYGKPSHTFVQCWHMYDEPISYMSQFSSLANYNFESSIMDTHSTIEDPLWYPHNGVSHHITKYYFVYSIKNMYQGTNTMKVGNG